MALGEPAAPFLGVERSVCGRRWRSREADPGVAAAIAERHGLPEIVGRLLAQRGIGIDEAPGFLAPRLRDQLPDPLHLRDMDRAVARLLRAVREGEAIVVFGDYDVDGATAAALLLRFFAAVGAHASVYVPDRMREGYGPNAPALLRLKAEGAAVVVTVDCGATAHEPLAAAAEAGLDIIVVDHHVTEPLLPPALALINPNRLDEDSPHGVLAAVGVAFLLVVALNRALREAGWYRDRDEPDLLQWLDLVALGTVCDVVPLTGLNRALELVRPRGTVILKSTAATGASLNLAQAVVNEITIVGSRCGRFAPAIVALESGRVDPRPLISMVFPLDDALAAFTAAGHAPNFKVLLKP